MIKELEEKIKALEEIIERNKKAKKELKEDKDKDFLEGYYIGVNDASKAEIKTLKEIIKQLKGE